MPKTSSYEQRNRVKEPLIELERAPAFVYAGRVSGSERYYLPAQHDQITEIIYLAAGKGTLTIGSSEHKVGAGDLVIFNSGVRHEELYYVDSEMADARLVVYHCGITDIHVKGIKEQWLIPENLSPILHTGNNQPVFQMHFDKLINELDARSPGHEMLCNNLVSVLSVYVIRMANDIVSILSDKNETLTPSLLSEKIKMHIDENYARTITIEELAAEFHITPSYLANIFKRHIGMPPIKYQISKRMDEAKRLLSHTELKINEIASRIGYENINTFYQPFKKNTGVTPKEYRKISSSPTPLHFQS
ncbi:MAG: AraC family transcriptional regulator [Defluviitaleaceae bacterium]|nr:AraC family transcriptional regulator [Defluviitaleaceae bacterium]